jgi:hypothetical protein
MSPWYSSELLAVIKPFRATRYAPAANVDNDLVPVQVLAFDEDPDSAG